MQKNNTLKLHIKNTFIAFCSGLIMALAWKYPTFLWLSFFAFVPILWLLNRTPTLLQYWLYSLISLLVWNISATYWLCYSTVPGGITAIIVNSLILSLPFILAYGVRSFFSTYYGLIVWIIAWMAVEYLHLNWQLSWPWLSLGNLFGFAPQWVQWYEYTGVGGGTVWMLVINSITACLICESKHNCSTIKVSILGITIVLFMGIPIWISQKITEKTDLTSAQTYPIAIVQPNIDPYQKFGAVATEDQVQQLLRLSMMGVDSQTQLLIFPETALSGGVELTQFEHTPLYAPIFQWIKKYPQLALVTGVETFAAVSPNEATGFSNKHPNGFVFNYYNAAFGIKDSTTISFYFKSKLVPGVEVLPAYFRFLAPLLEQFGGVTGGYTPSLVPVVFTNTKPFKVAPIICYESIYGDYVRQFVQGGANIICVLTNDGWWGETDGYKQHLNFDRLRAIETRRYVLRSANTGVSTVIDEKGNIQDSLGWNKEAVLKSKVRLNTLTTFYVENGDYVYRFFGGLAIAVFISLSLIVIQKKRRKKLN